MRGKGKDGAVAVGGALSASRPTPFLAKIGWGRAINKLIYGQENTRKYYEY